MNFSQFFYLPRQSRHFISVVGQPSNHDERRTSPRRQPLQDHSIQAEVWRLCARVPTVISITVKKVELDCSSCTKILNVPNAN